MNALDLQLFEILDEEIDKTLSFGSYYELDQENWIQIIDWSEEFSYSNWYWPYWVRIKDLDNWIWIISEILWHYSTTNEVLRYWYKIVWGYLINEIIAETLIESKNIYFELSWNKKLIFNLDITKPIQQYSDKQKQELIDFLLLIK